MVLPYTGMLIQGKEKRVVKGTHEPLVDVETFDRIQSEFKARSFNISPTPEASENVFKGKVICACCGGKMQRKRGTNHADWYFFTCISKNRLGADKCTGMYAREEDVLSAVYYQLLRATRENRIVPNYTTSGYNLTDREIELTKTYCGAVAVSFYSNIDKNGNEDNPPTITAIERFVKAGCITNVHFVLSKKSIKEAVYRVRNGVFPEGINAVVFLLYKPVGLASQDYVLNYDNPDYRELLHLVTSIDSNWKYGFDTCQSPAIYKFAPGVAIESVEFCEAARFSMYVNSRSIAFPCSFGIEDDTFSIDLKQHTLQEAWESVSFAKFRERQSKACANCVTGVCRSCGLELGLNLCGKIKGHLQWYSNPAPQ